MFYLCKKTLKMSDGTIGLVKGMAYECTEEGDKNSDYIIVSEVDNEHFMGKKFIKKHLVKIKDEKILASLMNSN
ncbi:TPA: hypothetical protein ROX91_002021 [Bacillus cereus]|nr:hypothetical protein [Bacillus cereus]